MEHEKRIRAHRSYSIEKLKRETNPNQKDVFQSAFFAAADDKEKKAGCETRNDVHQYRRYDMSVDFPIKEKENGITYYAAKIFLPRLRIALSIHPHVLVRLLIQTDPKLQTLNFRPIYRELLRSHRTIYHGPIYKVKCNPFWHPTLHWYPQDCPIFSS